MKRHYAVIMRAGGLLLIVVGVLLVTGEWNDINIWLHRNGGVTNFIPPV